jgi:ABC-type branched-subunit amino acid transport system ATPase component
VACENWRLLTLVRDLGVSRAPALSDPARAAIAEFGLSGALDQRPGQLSFAQRRLVDIARAVASGPSVLLLDEPGAGLDAHEVRELGALVRRLADDWGMGILLIEHHMDLVTAVCDRLVVLTRGKVLAEGAPDEVLRDSAVRYAYTGVGEQAV